jgi:hypothetical protein
MNYKTNKRISFLVMVSLLIIAGCGKSVKNYTNENKSASIFPDYTSVVIPQNIAPLNFIVNEKGDKYHIEIYSHKGKKIVIHQASPVITIPMKKWKNLLKQNQGDNLFVDVYVNKNKQWFKYHTIKDSIVGDEIDNHLAYRLIYATYLYWRKMGIYQRDLESFDEKPIFENSSADNGCVNCHSFCQNDQKKMLLHFRIIHPGTMILDGDSLKKLNTRTPYTMSGCVYPSWHPSGELIACTVLKLSESITSRKGKFVDVADKASDIVLLNIKTNTITTSPKISTKSRENLATWSPDGKWLYFISAPEAKKDDIESRLHVKYDLLRISYDYKTNTWGDVDTVLLSRETGLSITFPLISPDGKYLLFTMTDYGYFTAYHAMSDLYILDLNTKEYHKLDINSNSAESYHSWSSNGRWIAFSSKRLDGIYSRTFFAYFDKNGKTYKPFVLPQKDPLLYNKLLANYNRPELVKGEIELNARQVRDLVLQDAQPVSFDKNVDIDALSGATMIKGK